MKNTLTPRNIPLELIRCAADRRRLAEIEEVRAGIREGVFCLMGLAIYCFVLRAFIT